MKFEVFARGRLGKPPYPHTWVCPIGKCHWMEGPEGDYSHRARLLHHAVVFHFNEVTGGPMVGMPRDVLVVSGKK